MKYKRWKIRFSSELALQNRCTVTICAAATLAIGIIIGISGGLYPHPHYCLPKSALPTFFIILTWGAVFLLIGAVFGIFCFSRRCRSDERKLSFALWLTTLVSAYAWIPLFYRAYSLFPAFLFALILLAASLALAVSLSRSEPLAALGCAVVAIWAFYISYYSFATLLLNG